jgi:hypothetical protein
MHSQYLTVTASLHLLLTAVLHVTKSLLVTTKVVVEALLHYINHDRIIIV